MEFRRTERHASTNNLSRLPLKNQYPNTDQDEATAFSLSQVEHLPVTALKVQKAWRHDAKLSNIFRYAKIGWPKQVEKRAKALLESHDELCTEERCLI